MHSLVRRPARRAGYVSLEASTIQGRRSQTNQARARQSKIEAGRSRRVSERKVPAHRCARRQSTSLFFRRPHSPPTLDAPQEPDYYAVLAVATTASPAEIKVAYHRALLLHHPDKQANGDHRPDVVDVDLLKRAYSTLAAPDLRRKYNASRKTPASGPRPAQVVSLEEFSEHEEDWTYDCRCGGVYRITEQEMEEDRHLIGCTSCSEVVWVGYEVADGDEQ